MPTETVRYLDEPVELEIAGRRVQYAPMRMEWSFDPEHHPIEARELVFELEDEEPAVLQIHITEGCNLRCTYCSHFQNERKGSGTLSDEEIEFLLAEVQAMPAHGVLILHGGEPFTEPEIVLRFVEASPVTTVIYTNGTLITPEIIERLEGTKAVLLLSADGDEATTALARMGRKRLPMAGEIMGGIELVARSKVPFGIAMVMMDHNIDTIVAQVRYLMDRYDPDSFGVNTQHYVSQQPMQDIPPAQVADAYVQLLDLSMETGVYIDQIARRLTPILRGKSLLKDCSACGTKRVYHPGGTWMNCTNNIEEDKSTLAWSRYLPIFTESCHGCIAIGVCGGGCIADAKALNPGGFDDRFCESNRALVRHVLETCTEDDATLTTNREALEARMGGLLQRGKRNAGESLLRSIGHDALEWDDEDETSARDARGETVWDEASAVSLAPVDVI
jgi:radical SAM protein with 4Fe4S-binding SPASM domain